jgi:carbonic anhydrase
MCNACLDAGLSRRRVILSAAGLLAAAPLAGMALAQPVAAADTPDAALNLLIDGNARYVANQSREHDFSAGRASRTQGQAPVAAILGCADSRVAPELAFDQVPATCSWSVSPATSSLPMGSQAWSLVPPCSAQS